jgi:hypothetical protein
MTIDCALRTAFPEGANILFNTTIVEAIADRWVENSEIFLVKDRRRPQVHSGCLSSVRLQREQFSLCNPVLL